MIYYKKLCLVKKCYFLIFVCIFLLIVKRLIPFKNISLYIINFSLTWISSFFDYFNLSTLVHKNLILYVFYSTCNTLPVPSCIIISIMIFFTLYFQFFTSFFIHTCIHSNICVISEIRCNLLLNNLFLFWCSQQSRDHTLSPFSSFYLN